eukprot:309785_1
MVFTSFVSKSWHRTTALRMYQYRGFSTKKCVFCRDDKLLSNFNKHGTAKDGYTWCCKECKAKGICEEDLKRPKWMKGLIVHARSRRKDWQQFDIDIGHLMDLWHDNNGLCAITRYPMICETNSDFKCSLNKIDPKNYGYVKGKVELVLHEFNTPFPWTSEMFHNLPHKINENVDEAKMDYIFEKMHQMDKYDIRTNNNCCVYCQQNETFCTNMFCNQCKNDHPDIVKHWKFVRLQMVQRKRNSLGLSMGLAAEILKQQKYRDYYFNIPLVYESGSAWSLSLEKLSFVGPNRKKRYTQETTRFTCQAFQSAGNTNPKYNIIGSGEWTQT